MPLLSAWSPQKYRGQLRLLVAAILLQATLICAATTHAHVVRGRNISIVTAHFDNEMREGRR
jgi:hypothetical protein